MHYVTVSCNYSSLVWSYLLIQLISIDVYCDGGGGQRNLISFFKVVSTDVYSAWGGAYTKFCIEGYRMHVTLPHFTLPFSETEDHYDRQSTLCQAISKLPQPNRDTLAYLILHLQRYTDKLEYLESRQGNCDLLKEFLCPNSCCQFNFYSPVILRSYFKLPRNDS